LAAFANISEILTALTTSGQFEHVFYYVDSRVGASASTAGTAGRMMSLWPQNSYPNGAGAAPGAVAIPTNATVGSWGQTNASGGREKYLLGASATMGNNAFGTLIIYDRLLHISGLNGTTLTAQNVGGTLTRYTSSTESKGNQIWIEIYSQIGGSSTTITASYTKEDGTTSGRTTKAAAIGNTGLREAQRIIPLALQDGDLGVTAVASVTLAGTTGTAGDFGVTIAHPLLVIPISSANSGSTRDLLAGLPSLVPIKDNACLTAVFYSASAVAVQAFCQASFAER
jgi:hypothetical protein